MRSRPGRTSSQSPAPAGSSSQRCWPRWRSSSVTRPAGQKRTAAPTKRRSRVHAWEACHGENKTQDQGNRSKIKENQKKTAAKSAARTKARKPQRFVFSHHREQDFDQGLRPYSAYRDLGIAPATSGMVQAHVIRMTKPFT